MWCMMTFETVHAEDNQAPSLWPELLQFQTFRSEYDDEDFVPELSDEWVDESTLESRRRQRMERRGEATRPEMHESNNFPTQDSQADTNRGSNGCSGQQGAASSL